MMTSDNYSLFGEETTSLLDELSKNTTSELLRKIKSPKSEPKSVEKQLQSNKITLEDRLRLVKENAESFLGKHRQDIQVIRDERDLVSFIDKAIENGVIAYDTETNNSLDYLTCKVVGLCLYTPGLKAAYVPIWHVDPKTCAKLSHQVSEECAKNQLRRLRGTKVIMHNGKFDYQVTKCFFGVEMPIYWDTMVMCRLIDENEMLANLKWQYKDKVDPEHPDYDIDKVFPGIQYEYVDPDTFALYAATDALMTYELYQWQLRRLSQPDEERVLKLAMDVEMPLVIPVAEMEIRGVMFDSAYAKKLQDKYHASLDRYDALITEEIAKYSDAIAEWRLTEDATRREKRINKKGEPVYAKSKSEQLTEPINPDSSTQLAILLYDVLKVKPVDKKKPRTTDKKALPIIGKQNNLRLCELLLARKKVQTLLSDFIDKLPSLVNPVDGAIHCSFNQCGKEENGVVTGRFSSSNPNMQQIPSGAVEIRPVFMARTEYKDVVAEEDYLDLASYCEIATLDGYVSVKQVSIGTKLILNTETGDEVVKITKIMPTSDTTVRVYFSADSFSQQLN